MRKPDFANAKTEVQISCAEADLEGIQEFHTNPTLRPNYLVFMGKPFYKI